MSEHVIDWLNAYLDGELGGSRLHQVEKHLESCPQCQAELESLRGLSALLHSEPLPDAFPTASRFAAQVALRLPTRAVPAVPSKNRPSVAAVVWWLAPLGLLAAWAFVQTVFLLSNWIATAGDLGLLGGAAAWLNANGSPSPLPITLLEQVGILQGELASVWNGVEGLLAWGGLGQWLWQLPIALLFLGWLAGWVAWRNRQSKDRSFPVQS